MRDFQVEQSEFLKTEEVKRLVVLINKKYERPHEHAHALDLEGFVEFLLQMGDKMFDQKDKPSDFMPLLLERLREASYAARTPLFQKYFEDLYYEDALVAQFGGDKKKAKEAAKASK